MGRSHLIPIYGIDMGRSHVIPIYGIDMGRSHVIPIYGFMDRSHSKERSVSEGVRIGSIVILVCYEKLSSSYCVMFYFWWGCRRNLKLITLGRKLKGLKTCNKFSWCHTSCSYQLQQHTKLNVSLLFTVKWSEWLGVDMGQFNVLVVFQLRDQDTNFGFNQANPVNMKISLLN